jgi:sodium/hydrogen antiporter
MLPVIISLTGSGLRWETGVFLGWFGPRGLASILFVLLMVEHSDLAHQQEILMIVLTTVLLSIFLHGATANIGAALYQKILAACAARGDSVAAEHKEISEMPVRLPIND